MQAGEEYVQFNAGGNERLCKSAHNLLCLKFYLKQQPAAPLQ